MTRILGIETSCDDSSAAVVENGNTILSNVVAGQERYHQKFGGVVPEIAARKHLEHILPVIHMSLAEAHLSIPDIDAIAVTHRPGLVGSLIVGLTVAKSLAFLYEKPLIGIHHIEAHAYSACLSGLSYGTPHISLVASGGHTSLLKLDADNSMHLIGQTVDDAAGEAFDKVAKLLGFGYPGGPIIDNLSQQCPNPGIRFPRPMIDSDNFNFSFSGLKTAIMYFKKSNPHISSDIIASGFQQAVVDVLLTKTIQAARQFKRDTISVVGGVAANRELRERFRETCDAHGINLVIPPPRLCTDNAAMVAGLGYQKYIRHNTNNLDLAVNSHSGLQLRHI
jgi:N6-L-threonylcarbamoyladenine synthase